MSETVTLSEKEKILVALGAATGAGCRRCSEKLMSMLRPAGATTAEAEAAFAGGLRVRESATEVMRRKAGLLLGRALAPKLASHDLGGKVSELARLAAAVGANSAPDALEHLRSAEAAGATDAEIAVAIGIAHSVRVKAQQFSDSEVEESSPGEAAANDEQIPCCGASPKR